MFGVMESWDPERRTAGLRREGCKLTFGTRFPPTLTIEFATF